MAITQEDLLVREAIVYRFPDRAIRMRRAHARAVRRRRLVTGATVIVVAAGLLFATGPSGLTRAGDRAVPVTVTVAVGDTLWDLAERYAPPGSDLRAYVAALDELNDIEGPIQPGMELELPR